MRISIGLAVIGVVASVVGAFYYLRIVKVMYFDEPTGAFDRPIAVELKAVLLVSAAPDDVLLPVARPASSAAPRPRRPRFSRDEGRARRRCRTAFACSPTTRSAAPTTRPSGWRARGAPDRTLVWAREQTAGRGRRGRAWVSPPGNLYSSIDPAAGRAAPRRAAQLGFVAALGAWRGVREWPRRVESRFKWPNDLLAQRQKIAGILLESETASAGDVDFVVVGIGVNVLAAAATPNIQRPRSPPRAPPSRRRGRLLAAFVRALRRLDRRWLEEGFAPVRRPGSRGRRASATTSTAGSSATTLIGRFLDLDGDGALLLDTAAAAAASPPAKSFHCISAARPSRRGLRPVLRMT